MITRIFTDDQRQFLIKNIEEEKRISELMDKLNSIPVESVNSQCIDRLRAYLNDSQRKIDFNLQPFVKRNNIYQKKCAKILEKYGIGPQDMFSEDAIDEIISLQHEMLEEVSDLTGDLRGKKINEKEIGNKLNLNSQLIKKRQNAQDFER